MKRLLQENRADSLSAKRSVLTDKLTKGGRQTLCTIGTAVLAFTTGTLAADGIKAGLDSQTPMPALSQRVIEKVHGFLGDRLDITCETIDAGPVGIVQKAFGRSPGGYVQTYLVPFSTAYFPSQRIHLDVSICNTIDKMPPVNFLDQPPLNLMELDALVVTTHERTHTIGIFNEAETQCIAVQAAAGKLASYGYSVDMPALAKAMIKNYGGLPPEYKTPECRVGGPMDGGNRNGTSNAWLPAG